MSVNGLDKAGSTPLHWASHGGHTDCVLCLLSVPNCEVNVQVGNEWRTVLCSWNSVDFLFHLCTFYCVTNICPIHYAEHVAKRNTLHIISWGTVVPTCWLDNHGSIHRGMCGIKSRETANTFAVHKSLSESFFITFG